VILRRLLLILLVCLSASQIPGCATPAQICDVRQDYRHTAAIPARGDVRVTWERTSAKPSGHYGLTVCDAQGKNCHIQLYQAPDYNNVCAVHDFGHEMLHAMGANH
jgi:hypothetical protein